MDRLASCCVVALLLTAGCGPSAVPLHKSVPITGKVLVAGKPLPEGMIRVISTDNKSGQSAAEIKNGNFATNATVGPKRIEVIVPGKHSLSIYASDKSPLQAEVSEAGENHFEFDLKGK